VSAAAAATPEDLAAFHESLARASADARFLDTFYDGFMAASPQIAAIFAGRDMAALKRKLGSSLHVMTLAIDRAPGADMYLDYLARVHERFHIAPEMYDLWLDALVSAAAQCDPAFDDRLRRVWHRVVGAGILAIKPPPALAA
jgi:truncated hemoglobin YjbI